MFSEFVIHHHKTGRSHFDLRVVQNGVLRSWSLLKEPPSRNGERRLAIERENFPVEAIDRNHIEEELLASGGSPFGTGERLQLRQHRRSF